MQIIGAVCGLILSAFVTVSHASVIHLVDSDGSLTGANNVLVDGVLYDVEFSEDMCPLSFNGCDEVSDFVFDTFDTAVLAAQALLNQVFVDGEFGLFDSDSSLTLGCDNDSLCEVATYYGLSGFFNVDTAVARNGDYNSGAADSVFSDTWGTFWNLGSLPDGQDGFVAAVWSQSSIDEIPIEVSAPSTAIVLLMGLAGLVLCRRRTQPPSICPQSQHKFGLFIYVNEWYCNLTKVIEDK